jgi:hypothetical protein
MTARVPWAFFGLSVLIGFAILTIGFRVRSDSVFPEVVTMVASGFLLAFFRPGQAWLSAVGLGVGIALSAAFPMTSPSADLTRTANALPFSFGIWLRIWSFPVGGTLAGVATRLVLNAVGKPAQ